MTVPCGQGPAFPVPISDLAHSGHSHVFRMTDTQGPRLWTLDPTLAQLSAPPSSEGPTEAWHLELTSEGNCATSNSLLLMFGDTLHTTDAIRKPNSVLSGSKANSTKQVGGKIDESRPLKNK